MPTSRGGHGAHEALPPAAHVAAWEQLHPGTAAAILAEFQHDRRHARAMDWARLAVQSVTVLCGLGAVTALALLGHPLVCPDGSIQGAGLFVGMGSVIGLLAGRLQPARHGSCGSGRASTDPGERGSAAARPGK